MKENTDPENKPKSPISSEDDIIELTEEIEKSGHQKRINALKDKSPDFSGEDEEILVLKEEVRLSGEDKEDIIELIDEIPVNSQIESTSMNSYQKVDQGREIAGKQYVLIPLEDFKTLTGLSTDAVQAFCYENLNQAAISIEIIDAAIERVIQKRFGQKIEIMVMEAIKNMPAEDIKKLQQQILNQHEHKA